MKKRSTRRYRAQPASLIALKLPIPRRDRLDPDMRRYFAACDEHLGFLPNVLAAYSFDQVKRLRLNEIDPAFARRQRCSGCLCQQPKLSSRRHDGAA